MDFCNHYPSSPLYSGGGRVPKNDLQKVKLGIGRAGNGNQDFFFQALKKNCIHFIICKISEITYIVLIKHLWNGNVCGRRVLGGGAFFFNVKGFNFCLYEGCCINLGFLTASLPFQPQVRDNGMST